MLLRFYNRHFNAVFAIICGSSNVSSSAPIRRIMFSNEIHRCGGWEIDFPNVICWFGLKQKIDGIGKINSIFVNQPYEYGQTRKSTNATKFAANDTLNNKMEHVEMQHTNTNGEAELKKSFVN